MLFSTLTVHGVLSESAFLGELLRHSEGIEVREPLELREKMRQMIAETLKRY